VRKLCHPVSLVTQHPVDWLSRLLAKGPATQQNIACSVPKANGAAIVLHTCTSKTPCKLHKVAAKNLMTSKNTSIPPAGSNENAATRMQQRECSNENAGTLLCPVCAGVYNTAFGIKSCYTAAWGRSNLTCMCQVGTMQPHQSADHPAR
jgi:hypothetical protein